MKNVNINKFSKILLTILGSIFLCVGVIGIFIPLLPTTPFLLLSAACYIRGSKKLYLWLINHKYFGSYIKNYREKKGIPLKAKIISISMLWLTISFSAYTVNNLHITILLLVIAICVSIHMLSFKTL